MLRAWMEELGLLESEIKETFIKGKGKGGQKQNKTTNCVVLFHLESGLTVKCQHGRQREDNRYHARKILCQKLEFLLKGSSSQLAKEQEKIKKQKQRRRRRNNNKQ